METAKQENWPFELEEVSGAGGGCRKGRWVVGWNACADAISLSALSVLLQVAEGSQEANDWLLSF